MGIIRGKVINSREHRPNVQTAGTTPEKFKRMLDISEAKEAERLAARNLRMFWDKYNNEPYGQCGRVEFEAYDAARKRTDELEGK